MEVSERLRRREGKKLTFENASSDETEEKNDRGQRVSFEKVEVSLEPLDVPVDSVVVDQEDGKREFLRREERKNASSVRSELRVPPQQHLGNAVLTRASSGSISDRGLGFGDG